MSIIDKFYDIFPVNIVFKILKYKPHDNAILIKQDLEDIGYQYVDAYPRLFEYNRIIHAAKKKAIKRKNELEKNIKLAYDERRDFINKIMTEKRLCDECYSCITLLNNHLYICDNDCDDILQYCDDAVKCFHYDSIQDYEKLIKKCDIKIKDYNRDYISAKMQVEIYLNMKISDVYELSNIV